MLGRVGLTVGAKIRSKKGLELVGSLGKKVTGPSAFRQWIV